MTASLEKLTIGKSNAREGKKGFKNLGREEDFLNQNSNMTLFPVLFSACQAVQHIQPSPRTTPHITSSKMASINPNHNDFFKEEEPKFLRILIFFKKHKNAVKKMHTNKTKVIKASYRSQDPLKGISPKSLGDKLSSDTALLI